MSATMEADKYLEYFKHKDFSGNISRPRHIHVSSGNFHVDEVYLDALKHLGNVGRRFLVVGCQGKFFWVGGIRFCKEGDYGGSGGVVM